MCFFHPTDTIDLGSAAPRPTILGDFYFMVSSDQLNSLSDLNDYARAISNSDRELYWYTSVPAYNRLRLAWFYQTPQAVSDRIIRRARVIWKTSFGEWFLASSLYGSNAYHGTRDFTGERTLERFKNMIYACRNNRLVNDWSITPNRLLTRVLPHTTLFGFLAANQFTSDKLAFFDRNEASNEAYAPSHVPHFNTVLNDLFHADRVLSNTAEADQTLRLRFRMLEDTDDLLDGSLLAD